MSGEPAIRAIGIGKRYPRAPPGVAALADLSLTVPAGKIYGLIGQNGAGKTTFIRIAATQLTPSSGEMYVLGHPILREERAIRARIACVPQESRPLYFLNTEEVVYLYLKLRGIDPLEARRRTRAALEELSLWEYRRRQVSRLSGGLRRRALVAMVLASDADLLFLDEPTTGLDPLARRQVWEAIRRASREHRTILLTTHYLDEAEALSSRIALIDKGQMLLEGTASELRARVRLPYRVSVQGSALLSELEPYGRVSAIEGGFLVFAREADARELARWALERGHRISMGPVTLEDVFLEVVGHPIEQDEPLADGAEAA
ncbi:MAG: ABC transporter ATP-binding protein [Thermoplasmata archaeon]|jgi:ABC-2 type transport system ATP-binding protein|nr:ABC transporter ATP-binding protein [Thermoplasmata archaeon]